MAANASSSPYLLRAHPLPHFENPPSTFPPPDLDIWVDRSLAMAGVSYNDRFDPVRDIQGFTYAPAPAPGQQASRQVSRPNYTRAPAPTPRKVPAPLPRLVPAPLPRSVAAPMARSQSDTGVLSNHFAHESYPEPPAHARPLSPVGLRPEYRRQAQVPIPRAPFTPRTPRSNKISPKSKKTIPHSQAIANLISPPITPQTPKSKKVSPQSQAVAQSAMQRTPSNVHPATTHTYEVLPYSPATISPFKPYSKYHPTSDSNAVSPYPQASNPPQYVSLQQIQSIDTGNPAHGLVTPAKRPHDGDGPEDDEQATLRGAKRQKK